MINIIINEKKETIERQNIQKLIELKKINENEIILLLNEKIIKKRDFEKNILNENDRVEIISFFDGG